jgi:hypothetical protein
LNDITLNAFTLVNAPAMRADDLVLGAVSAAEFFDRSLRQAVKHMAMATTSIVFFILVWFNVCVVIQAAIFVLRPTVTSNGSFLKY